MEDKLVNVLSKLNPKTLKLFQSTTSNDDEIENNKKSDIVRRLLANENIDEFIEQKSSSDQRNSRSVKEESLKQFSLE